MVGTMLESATRTATSRARRRVGLALALAGASLIAAVPGYADSGAAAPAPDAVTIGVDVTEAAPADGAAKAVAVGIPVDRAQGPQKVPAGKRVVAYSVALPPAADGATTTLRVRGVAALSRCNANDHLPGAGTGRGSLHSPCEDEQAYKPPFSPRGYDESEMYGERPNLPGDQGYAPSVAGRLFLAESPAGTPGDRAIGPWRTRKCPKRTHHCPITIETTVPGVGAAKPLYLNLVVVAFHPQARVDSSGGAELSKDIVELEADCAGADASAGGDYNPDSPGDAGKDPFDDNAFCDPVRETQAEHSKAGQLTVVRAGESYPAPTPLVQSAPLVDRLPVSTIVKGVPQLQVVFSARIEGASPGDVIEARSELSVKNDPQNGSYEFDHLVGSYVLLTSSPTERRWVEQTDNPFDRMITSIFGRNCFGAQGCSTATGNAILKTGAVAVPPGAPAESEMYVNVVANAIDKAAKDAFHGKKNAKITAGELKVACLPRSSGPSGDTPCRVEPAG